METTTRTGRNVDAFIAHMNENTTAICYASKTASGNQIHVTYKGSSRSWCGVRASAKVYGAVGETPHACRKCYGY